MSPPPNSSRAGVPGRSQPSDSQLEETIPVLAPEDSVLADLLIDPVRQMRDLAFAAALVKSGMMTETELSSATRNWTSWGMTRLQDHLVTGRVLDSEQALALQTAAQSELERIREQIDSPEGVDADRRIVHILDPENRLGPLLGLSGGTLPPTGSQVDRQIAARYTLLRRLGQGGLGTVWLARDHNLHRFVAIKELHAAGAGNPAALEQFRREAEVTGRLEHPGIVPVYQFGRDEGSGTAFYAMRFVGRRTLQDAIDEYHQRRQAGVAGPMRLQRLLTSFIGICHAIGHAHSCSVIHRDLKPANIALDEFDQVTILDWGLSRVDDETGVYSVEGRDEPGDLHDRGAPLAERVIGTPLYMAPEQASGRLEDVDPTTDVYGLGGILYAILTGVAPHQASCESAGSGVQKAEILSRIVAADVPPPEQLCEGISPELSAICRKALDARPFCRYQSAEELADDIQRFIARRPVTAYQPPVTRRVSQWMSRHPSLTQMLLLSVSLLLIGGGSVFLTAREAEQRIFHARLNAAAEAVRDLDSSLAQEARALERDLRFVSELPLMNMIVSSDTAVRRKPSDTLPADDSGRSEPAAADIATLVDPAPDLGEEGIGETARQLDSPVSQLLDRQGELFDGFLNANPSYLLMATSIQTDESVFRELVRSERAVAGNRPRRVPPGQLIRGFQLQSADGTDVTQPPSFGSVSLSVEQELPNRLLADDHSPLVLSGVAPIYDPAGAFFGINIIELDMRSRLETLLPSVVPDHLGVLVTDRTGRILIDYSRGRVAESNGQPLATERFPGLAPLFAENRQRSVLNDDENFYASVVRLGGRSSDAEICVVAWVAADDAAF